MFVLKVIAPLFVLAVALTQIALEHRWHDRRTKKHRRIRGLLVLLLIISTCATIAVVASDHRSSQKLEEQVSGLRMEAGTRESAAKQERAVLQEEVVRLEQKLDPFLKVALARFPNLAPESALQRLSEEIDVLRERTMQLETATESIARRDHYRPVDAAIRERVVGRLRSLGATGAGDGLAVSIYADTGDRNRQLVAAEFAEILREAGFEVAGPSSGITFSEGVLPSIRFKYHPDDRKDVRAFAEALDGLFAGEVSGRPQESHERGKLAISIYGTPMFAPDGSVTLR